ncbi:hypothetical protein ACFX2C_009909 [Malus domestica]
MSLPADLSLETPPISLRPPLPVSEASDQQLANQLRVEEFIRVSLPADLSVETPPISPPRSSGSNCSSSSLIPPLDLLCRSATYNTTPVDSGFSPCHQEILSPSLLDFPSLTLSPVMSLNDYPFAQTPLYRPDPGLSSLRRHRQ